MKHSSQTITLTLLAALGMSSCSDMTEAQAWGATALGALGGAAAGAGVGALAGGKNHRAEGIVIGAITGAIIGGVATNVWARSQVKPRSEYPSSHAYVQANSQQLDSRISSARKTSKALQNKKQSSSKISKDELAEIKKANAENAKLIQQDITTANKAMAEATPEEKKALRAQVNTLEQERANMAAQVRALSAA